MTVWILINYRIYFSSFSYFLRSKELWERMLLLEIITTHNKLTCYNAVKLFMYDDTINKL